MSNKKLTDRIMLFLWISLILISGLKQVLVDLFGGVGYLGLSYALFAYFIFIYQKNNIKRKMNIYPFALFLFCYIFLLQVFQKGGLTYESMGVQFHLYVWNLITTLPYYFSALIILQSADYDDLSFIKKVAGFEIIILVISTIGILTIDPLASKLTAVGGNETEYFLLMGYGMVYGLATILPFFLFDISRQKKKGWKIVLFCLICISILMASYTIAIFTATIGVICYLLLKIKNQWVKIVSITVTVAAILVLFVSGAMADLLEVLARMMPMDEVAKRLEQIADAFRTGDTYDTTIRFDIYGDSWMEFLQHPILGNIFVDENSSSLWGHSTNLDILAGFGIFVFLLYISFPINVFRYNYRCSSNLDFKATTIASFIAFLFLSTFNPILSGTEIISLFILAPAVINSKEGSNGNNFINSPL